MMFKKPMAAAFVVVVWMMQSVAADFTVAERGKGAVPVRLVTPDAPSAKYAAEELRDYVKKLTGEASAIVTSAPNANFVAVELDPAFADDVFRIVETNGMLRIAGGKRGVLYGVYEVLERFGDVGWYASWHEIVPKTDRFAVPGGIDVTCKPAFELREPLWYDAFDADFAARLRVNGSWQWVTEKHGGKAPRFGGGLGNCHTFDILVPCSKYFKEHPEYFSEIGGGRRSGKTQLCLTNPDVLSIVISNVLQRIARDPTARFYGVSQNDNALYCQCANCAAVDEEEGSHAGTMMRFINAVADAVAAKYPDKIIETLAYQHTRKPPKTRPRPNVMPCLCSIECDFAEPLATGRYKENEAFRNDLRGWAGVATSLYVWDYAVNFDHYLHAFPNINVLQDNLRLYRDSNVRYMFEQGDYHGIHSWFAELKAYLVAKWMWNPDLPADALMDRFFKGYYGKAAPLVRRHLAEIQERQARRSSGGRRPLLVFENVKDSVCDLPFLERSVDLWRAAERAVANEDPVYGYNVRMGALSVVYTLFNMTRNFSVTRHPEGHLGRFPRAELAKWMLARFAESKKRIWVQDDNSGRSTERFLGVLRETAECRDGGVIGSSDSAVILCRDLSSSYAKTVDDATANGGKAKLMTRNHYDWDVAFNLREVAYDPGEKYTLRIHVRVNKVPGAPDGEAFSAGIWNPKARRGVAEIKRKVSQCADGWAWYEVATWQPCDDDSLWIAPGWFDRKQQVENLSIESVSCDCIEIRRKDDGSH